MLICRTGIAQLGHHAFGGAEELADGAAFLGREWDVAADVFEIEEARAAEIVKHVELLRMRVFEDLNPVGVLPRLEVGLFDLYDEREIARTELKALIVCLLHSIDVPQ